MNKIDHKLRNKILQLYLEKEFDIIKIANKLNISKTSVHRILKDSGSLQDKRTRRLIYAKHKLNATFFDEIDTEEKAYWLGFIYADGNVDLLKRSLVVNVSSIDDSHITQLANIFGVSVKHYTSLKNGKILSQSRVKINNIYLCESLTKIGVMPQKTLIDSSECFNHVKPKMMHHFVRGFFDGDGHFSSTGFGFVGGLKFLQRLRKELNFMRTDGSLFPDKTVWRLSWNGRLLTNQFISWVYKDSTLHLKRKHDKIKTFAETKKAAQDFADSVS